MGENALQFIQGAVADDQLSLALLTMPDLHRSAQALGQALFQAGDVRVALDRSRRLARGMRPLPNQGFGLTYGQPMCDNMSRPFHLPFCRQTEERTGMAHFQVAMGKQGLDLFRQADQAQQVGNGRARLADRFRDLLLGQLELLLQALQGSGFLDRIESSRWMFSISAMAMAASSGTSRTSAGIFSSPACWLARQRRSPAMIS